MLKKDMINLVIKLFVAVLLLVAATPAY